MRVAQRAVGPAAHGRRARAAPSARARRRRRGGSDPRRRRSRRGRARWHARRRRWSTARRRRTGHGLPAQRHGPPCGGRPSRAPAAPITPCWKHDEADRQHVRPHLLVERQRPDHHEVVEVRLRRPVPGDRRGSRCRLSRAIAHRQERTAGRKVWMHARRRAPPAPTSNAQAAPSDQPCGDRERRQERAGARRARAAARDGGRYHTSGRQGATARQPCENNATRPSEWSDDGPDSSVQRADRAPARDAVGDDRDAVQARRSWAGPWSRIWPWAVTRCACAGR